MAWARRRARRILGTRADELPFIEANVMSAAPPAVPPAHIISVLNFSILYLREAAQLQAYLQHAWRCLASPGLLVLNLFGGAGALKPHTDRHLVTPRPRLASEAAVPPFEFQWEQRHVDAATRRIDCRIHFRLRHPAGTGGVVELHDAFRYDWRLWPLAELIDALKAAGFDDVQVWRHTHDPARGAAGVFLGPVSLDLFETLDQWTAYIVASRGAGPGHAPPLA